MFPWPARNRRAVRVSAPQHPAHHLLADEIVGHLGVELHVEPSGEPARFRPLQRRDPQQWRLRNGLIEILDDGLAACQNGAVILDQHRHLARRIEREELRPAFPDRLQPRLEFELLSRSA